jgi:catechol 2,3-dioxygenase-like lactoylglutathione lyase family enzyme
MICAAAPSLRGIAPTDERRRHDVGGVELLNGPMDRPWGNRTASFRDPGGHIWEIAT